MKLTVDRIEGNIAVLEDENGTFRNIPANELPSGIKDGDVLSAEGGSYELLTDETSARKAHIKSLRRKLERKK